ncbi:hypothetical protein SD77_3272 [Bacillus badius]|uniref:Mobile element protein n=1 Tax=Bacillus badius TaxID=1455 RepID=A0ABR5AXD8_BACBA|nr:hypothetical protein SD78_0135 [Bacillus badius]KIL79406.1 hypothetical protein SD77_3272 [Bacillus badius]
MYATGFVEVPTTVSNRKALGERTAVSQYVRYGGTKKKDKKV